MKIHNTWLSSSNA